MMTRIALRVTGVLLLASGLCAAWNARRGADLGESGDQKDLDAPFGIEARTPWTTSRITGSPEPPPPYRTERAFPKLRPFEHPLLITRAPGTDRLFVAEQAGKLYSIPNERDCEQPDLFLDLAKEIQTIDPAGPAKRVGDVYGLAFHPNFEKNRYCYVCYTLVTNKPDEQLADGTRVSRFEVTETDPPRCDPKSETMLITWLAGGHNGGCLEFGPKDGYLYISSGDAAPPSPPDPLDAGQDVSNLLSAILRIDVDRSETGRRYAIPPDNPFVHLAGARGEIWAYGFRNPWRMGFDRVTGDLWVGDVGWELWEMVYRIERGGNYGWSIMEGPQPVHPEGRRGPTPILPPTIELPHSEAASITGGYVYRGKRFPELIGAYIFGDWETRRMWAARYDGSKIDSRQEIVEPTLRIVAFGEDHDGELNIVDYDDGTIHQLVRNETREQAHEFPRRLSETGLFSSVSDHTPAPGVIPFSINAEQWADGATAERLVALPGETTIRVHPEPVPVPGTIMVQLLEFPADAVLAKTVSLEMERGNPESRRRIETQILHYNGKTWRTYSFQWNDEQTDATLVAVEGLDSTYSILDPQAPGGARKQAWNFAGRATCSRCHNPWAQHTLAFNIPQINRSHDYGRVVDNQLRTLKHIGILSPVIDEKTNSDHSREATSLQPLVNPYDKNADLHQRARSYLHVNCSHCHQSGAGGTAEIDLRYEFPTEKTKTLGIRPKQGTFGIHDAHIVLPGDPYGSVLFYRISKLGRGRMPYVGSEIIDERGVRLIHDWIRQLPVRTDEVVTIERLRELDEPTARARELEQGPAELARLSRELAKLDRQQEGIEPTAQPAVPRPKTEERAQARARERAETIAQLLRSTSSALHLAYAIGADQLPPTVRDEVIAAAVVHPDIQVRDLFEKYVPEENRAKRLGSVIRPAEILGLQGDADRGKELFFNTAGVQCKNCHRIGDVGSTLGPELSQIGKKYNRAQLLESILEPSKLIDPKYVMYLVETTQGRVESGLLVEKTDREIVLRNAQDQEIRILATDVERLVPQRQSIMPELLLRDMTASQVADLLEYLESLR